MISNELITPQNVFLLPACFTAIVVSSIWFFRKLIHMKTPIGLWLPLRVFCLGTVLEAIYVSALFFYFVLFNFLII